ncbi:MAG: right-handed parallel beta-helix repeat-containing protein [Bacteroidota bacterium]
MKKNPGDSTISPDKICLSCEGGGGGGSGSPVTCDNSKSTLYVDASRPNNSGDGYSWSTAKQTLHAALYLANRCTNITRINVAEGNYKASNTTTPTAATRDNNFFIGDSYSIYGGYPTGGGTRNYADNPTILDGEIVDLYEAYHVIVIYGVTGAIVIDGFQIKNGFAEGTGSIELEPGVNMNRNDGAGIYIRDAANVTIRNCAIYGNVANSDGAGIFTAGSGVNLVNTVFVNNTVAINGGGMVLTASSTATVTNCTFYNNYSAGASTGGTIYANTGSDLTVANTIVWGNSSEWGGGGTRTVTYSLVEDGTTSNNCLVSNPRFNNTANLDGADNKWFTADDGLSLSFCSPAINRGNNAATTSATDITADSRVYNTQVDMGAYEKQSIPGVNAPTDRSLAGDTSNTYVYGGSTALVADGNCRLIGVLTPNGANPVTGRITAETFIIGGTPMYNGQPYVTRHTDIRAFSNSGSATSNITLWFSNSEFNNFNLRAEAISKLPTTDGMNKQNLRIVQYHGTSATGLPGTYSGGFTIIDPDDADITWSPVTLSWKVSFNVTGFSGFFLTAVTKYRFTGNGNWNDPANWQNGMKPPLSLPSWCEIAIAAGTNCILSGQQTISKDSRIIVEAGANLQVNGNLVIQ